METIDSSIASPVLVSSSWSAAKALMIVITVAFYSSFFFSVVVTGATGFVSTGATHAVIRHTSLNTVMRPTIITSSELSIDKENPKSRLRDGEDKTHQ